MELIEQHLCFGGMQSRYKHHSGINQCEMTFSIFLPEKAHKDSDTVPLIVWLSGLTCTDENFVTKAGAQQYANEYGIAILCPDTSPRGEGVANDDAYDLGQGAGFYLNALNSPWSAHFHMYDYLIKELIPLVIEGFPIDAEKMGISGHSMGGHGALVLGLRNPELFNSISAFAPICAPSQCPWGEKAFTSYLGEDTSLWQDYDACALLSKSDYQNQILVDQGEADNFLKEQLKPEILAETAEKTGTPLELRYQPGYDHSYFFIASFIGDHIKFHKENINS